MRADNEIYAEEAFSKQSSVFDQLYTENTIVNYKRQRVREHVLQYLRRSGTILELNSGTGEDALFFAKKGHHVHATDLSEGMQQQLMKKVELSKMGRMITNERCSFTGLQQLQHKGPYDHIFSNFAGLNCTGDLDKVLSSLSPLLKPGGVVTMVILPKFCLWEILLVFKGKFRTAFRRIFSKNGQKAHLEGTYFTCWYYNPSYVINCMKDSYSLLSVEGLCTVVPPSYIEGFAEKHPLAYRLLKKAEEKLRYSWPWKYIGDYYIISLVKK
jgi:ubiquinone/menaquinone biosynthesis C-methylase UbiE